MNKHTNIMRKIGVLRRYSGVTSIFCTKTLFWYEVSIYYSNGGSDRWVFGARGTLNKLNGLILGVTGEKE